MMRHGYLPTGRATITRRGHRRDILTRAGPLTPPMRQRMAVFPLRAVPRLSLTGRLPAWAAIARQTCACSTWLSPPWRVARFYLRLGIAVLGMQLAPTCSWRSSAQRAS